MLKRPLVSAALLVCLVTPAAYPRAGNELALEIPADGGGMLMYSRSWRVARYVYAGFVAGAGQIEREFDLEVPGQPSFEARTKTLVLPMVGPRLTLVFPVIAVSVGYAAFWGRTDLDVKVPGGGSLTGETKGWGSGLYSPLLSIEFYSEKRDMVFGVGLGGFFGTSFPDLSASGGGSRITTDENPIDTLTFHLKMGWGDGRRTRREKREDLDDL